MKLSLLICGCMLMLASGAHAQVQSANQDDINTLMQKISAEPNNLDNYFQYAKIAEAIGEPEKAINAYQTMLKLDPTLDRVKLDLSVVYMKLNRVQEAKTLLQEVLDRQPPEQVRHNIETILAGIKANAPGHSVNGFVQLGFVSDSNANSSPSTGNVTVFDTSLPLEGNGLTQSDVSMTAAAGLNHRYRFTREESGNQWDWNSGITAYQTLQQDQDQLNLQLFSVRTGPSVTIPDARMNVGLEGSAAYITLDNEHYLDVYSLQLSAEKQFSDAFSLTPSATVEYRDFHNSGTVTTYEDRTGPAYQFDLTGRYLITERDMVDANISWRREDTDKSYYANTQWAGSLGYSHLFNQGYFTNLRGGLRRSLYDDPDLFISSRTRADFERYGQILIGKNFENNISATLMYMYRDVDSNLQNYAYDNHRFMFTVAYKF